MAAISSVRPELAYLLLVLALLLIPKALQRYRVPAPLTALAFGIGAMLLVDGVHNDAALRLLATLGISSLFLFAGLEVDLQALHSAKWPLLGHLVIATVTLAALAWGGAVVFGWPWQVASLLALALLTPSTGFILDTLERRGLDEDERFWVSSKAIAGELLALLLLFVVLQSGSARSLAVSTVTLTILVIALPFLFILLGRLVTPYAPGSEFSLLVLVGLIAAYATKELGVYYLVGAFLAGFVARRLRDKMPALASDDNLHAVGLFASFFIPFYFFASGLRIPPEALHWQALALGLLLAASILPCRIGIVWLQRRWLFGESPQTSLRVAITLAPTLIFTLVLADILRERFGISDTLYGGLLVYAVVNTALPSFVLTKQAVDFDPALHWSTLHDRD